jgi:hypothetical protein
LRLNTTEGRPDVGSRHTGFILVRLQFSNVKEARADVEPVTLCSGTVLHLCYFVGVQERVASSEIVSTWVDDGRCPYINEVKTIVHPGEVRAAVTPCDAALWGLWAAGNWGLWAAGNNP